MTVEELKSETARLPVEQRVELAAWLERDEEVRHEWLKAAIEEGLADDRRGDVTVCEGMEQLRDFINEIREEAVAEVRQERQERQQMQS